MDLKYILIIPALVLKLLVLGIYTFRCIRYMRRKRKRERVLTPAPDYIVPPIPMPWHKHWHDAEAARSALPRARSDGISSVAQASAPYPAVPYPTNSPYPTGTPYPHPSYQPAMLHPEGAGYPQGFATAAGYPPPGVAAAPHPTYPSAPYPTYPSAPDANVMPPSYEQAVCAKPPPHNPFVSH